MNLKHTFIVLALLAANFCAAQESMMSEVSYPFLEKLISAAKNNYPKIKAYESRVRISEENIHKAKLDWFNIFTFTYLYSPNNSTTLVNPTLLNGYQLGFFTSVGNILQKPGAVKVAREEYNIAKLDQQEYNLNIEAIVKQRYFTYLQHLTILNWRTKTIESAESAVKDLKYKFEKGETTFEEYNKALGYYANSVQFKLESEGAFLIAKANLEEITGKKLEDIK